MRPWIGVLLVAVGGAVGAVARHAANEICRSAWIVKLTRGLPLSTLIVNVGGCFLIGLLMALVRRGQLSEECRLLLVTGGLGGLTTFSAFGYETWLLTQDELFGSGPALANVVANVALSLLAVWLGWRLGT